MRRAITVIVVIGLASYASALDAPVRWNIDARIVDVNGTPPEGPLSQLGFDWNLNFVVTVANTEPAPDGMIPGGEHQQRLVLTDGFSIDFDAPDDADDFMFVDVGSGIDGTYIPRNQDDGDSADYIFSDLPLMNSRGELVDTFTVRFGFFGGDELLGDDNEFISMPDLSSVDGTGIFVEFENGAFAFGELVEWNSVVIPAPGPAGLIGFGAVAALRRRGH